MSNLLKRVLSAALLLPALIGLMFYAPPWAFALTVLLAATFSFREYASMLFARTLMIQHATVLIGLASMLWVLRLSSLGPASVGLLAAMLLLSLSSALFVGKQSENFIRVGWLMLAPVYIGLSLCTVLWLHELERGPWWVLLAMSFAFAGDTAAYFVGSAFGKHKLAPAISPNKTIEGAVGGLLGSVLAALIFVLGGLLPLPVLDAVLLALVAGLFGQTGDLFESMLKRAVNIKDSGSLIPGHGGMLDRIDALLFTSAVTWIYMQFY
ncbi:MAG: phosphatidate cytidylyltransferase [Myxococcales bacterium]|nr:MAG: phosphatidate cytidylyltransferase [Myxococcales bacterium]